MCSILPPRQPHRKGRVGPILFAHSGIRDHRGHPDDRDDTMAPMRQRFEGFIAGVGSTSGIRVVVGHWPRSPFGSFTDAMVERADGHRILLAPTAEVQDFVAATYTFDETRIEPITASAGSRLWHVTSPSLDLTLTLGTRRPLGWLLHGIPTSVATSVSSDRLRSARSPQPSCVTPFIATADDTPVITAATIMAPPRIRDARSVESIASPRRWSGVRHDHARHTAVEAQL